MGRIVSVGRMVEEEVELSTKAAVNMGRGMVVGRNGATGVPMTEPG